MTTERSPQRTFVRVVPRSIEDRDYWDGVRKDPRHAPFLANVQKAVEKAPDAPVMPTASDFLAARRDNNRGVLDRHWKKTRHTLSSLAIHRCLGGIERDDRLLNHLWALLTEATWTVSAHLPNNDLPASEQPTLDLASCSLAGFFAELREVLKPWMDDISGTLADSIVTEIDRRILTPFKDGIEVWWEDRDGGTNNWLGVCAGTILTACESLAAQGHPRPEARERALAGLSKFLQDSFTEHGECDEGIGYWAYGMRKACLGWSRLTREEFETHVDSKRLEQVADYPKKVHLFANHFYSGNDGALQNNALVEFVPWLSVVTGSTFLADWAREYPIHEATDFGPMLRILASPADLPPSAVGTPATASSSDTIQTRLVEDQQVAIFGAETSKGKLQTMLAGGHNNERHNHNDLGHFVIALGDEIVVPDMGAPVYRTDFFGPKRYTYVSASSRGHNCPLIEDHEQRRGDEAAGKTLEWSPEADTPRFVLDLTSAYPEEADLIEWHRGLECRPADQASSRPLQMVITDAFKTKQPNQRITLALWSYAKPENHDEIHVAGGGVRFLLDSLFCEFSPSPVVIGNDKFEAEELLLRNPMTLYRLHAVYRTDDKGQLKVETRFYARDAGS